VSDKPKRRWYQFSLGTLFVVTMLCCLIAALVSMLLRSRQFQEQAAFHRRQLPAPTRESVFVQDIMRGSLYSKNPAERAEARHYLAMIRYHEEAAAAYEEAAKSPWLKPAVPPQPTPPAPAPKPKADPVAIPRLWTELEEIVETPTALPNPSAPARNPPRP